MGIQGLLSAPNPDDPLDWSSGNVEDTRECSIGKRKRMDAEICKIDRGIEAEKRQTEERTKILLKIDREGFGSNCFFCESSFSSLFVFLLFVASLWHTRNK